MTLDDIINRIKQIEAEQRDDERAHILQDRLYRDFTKFIANGPFSELSEMASEVLKVEDMAFERWYA